MAKKLETRVSDLEKQSGGSGVKAVWHGEAEKLQVLDTGEWMTSEEFSAKYPDGTIIHLVYVDWSEAGAQAAPGRTIVEWDDGEDSDVSG